MRFLKSLAAVTCLSFISACGVQDQNKSESNLAGWNSPVGRDFKAEIIINSQKIKYILATQGSWIDLNITVGPKDVTCTRFNNRCTFQSVPLTVDSENKWIGYTSTNTKVELIFNESIPAFLVKHASRTTQLIQVFHPF